jgi:hypothetical protein
VEAKRHRPGLSWLMLVLLPGAWILAGCGSVSTTTITRSSPPPSPPTGTRTFNHRGIALHFQYPAAFASARIRSVARRLDRGKHVTRAALGFGNGRYDLLVISRHPDIKPPISTRNIRAEKPAYDRAISRLFGHRVRSRVSSAGGLPALSYPAVPTPGVPNATTRATFVFLGRDEYELQCQWTPTDRAALVAACNQMLRTLHR